MAILRLLSLVLSVHLVSGGNTLRGSRAGLAPEASPSVHFLYTTGCNQYQLTHSIVLDHSWLAAGNVGRLTRIVAGCTTPQAREDLSRSPLSGSSDFSVFMAEGDLDLIPSTKERYPARSRPHAITQWLEHTKPSDDLLCIVDPDFLFLRPISSHPSLAQVKPGRMLSSSGWDVYGDGSNDWIPRGYRTGPVWVLTMQDLRTLLPEWKSLTDSWEKRGDGLMREQYAFQSSAFQHRLPADFVDDFATEIMWRHGPRANPYALHYFRSYDHGPWSFHKALATTGWYADHFNNSVPPPAECGAPLLQEPPPLGQEQKYDGKALSLVLLLPRMNAAFRAHREVHCPEDSRAFAERGLGAFGLVRLAHPFRCPSPSGEITRYVVDPELQPDWEEEQALGGNRCSRAAQMLPQADA